MNKHTPGPWEAHKQHVYRTAMIDRNGFVATADSPYVAFEEANANARLIAAAPLMADMIRDAIMKIWWSGAADEHPAIANAWAALAGALKEATGEELDCDEACAAERQAYFTKAEGR